MKSFLFLVLVAVTVSCGLKPAPLNQKELSHKGNGLLESLQVSEGENYVVRSIKTALTAGETNSVQYRWISTELTELDQTPRTFKVEYWMPEMPEMGKFEASAVYSNGVLSADLDIVHGGLWEVNLVVHETGKPEDRVVFSYQVAE